MAKKVFISFRFSDGNSYKTKLANKFESLKYTIDKSETGDHSNKTEDQIWEILKPKLKDTSLTVVILSPKAIKYHKTHNSNGKFVIDDWLYDELRYSLEDRESNRTNGVIALYTPNAKDNLIDDTDGSVTIKEFNNLVRKNMFNVKDEYKYCPDEGKYNREKDHYISLYAFDTFMDNPQKYIDSAIEKRNRKEQFNLVKRM